MVGAVCDRPLREMPTKCSIYRGVLVRNHFPGGNSWGAGGGGLWPPPTFGQQHFFQGLHIPQTERYHQKWC